MLGLAGPLGRQGNTSSGNQTATDSRQTSYMIYVFSREITEHLAEQSYCNSPGAGLYCRDLQLMKFTLN